jgi:hypothetical protein
MPNQMFQFATVARVFVDEVELAEAPSFPEISALDDGERKWRSCLQAKAKTMLNDDALSRTISLHRWKFRIAIDLPFCTFLWQRFAGERILHV